MNSYFVLYLCSIADSVGILFVTLGIIGIILSTIVCFMCFCASSKSCDKCYDLCLGRSVARSNPYPKTWLTLSVIILALGVLTPSTNSCYKILGVGATIEYVKGSSELKQLPDNAVKALNEYLKEVPTKKENKSNKNKEEEE